MNCALMRCPNALIPGRWTDLSRDTIQEPIAECIDGRSRAQQELWPEELRLSRDKDSRWASDDSGFSPHTGVDVGALDPNGREKLVRCCLRPAISNQRISVLADGSIAYELNAKMRHVALITKQHIVDRVLSHLQLPLRPEQLGEHAVGYDITDEPMPGWVLGMDPDPEEPDACERGPPADCDGVECARRSALGVGSGCEEPRCR